MLASGHRHPPGILPPTHSNPKVNTLSRWTSFRPWPNVLTMIWGGRSLQKSRSYHCISNSCFLYVFLGGLSVWRQQEMEYFWNLWSAFLVFMSPGLYVASGFGSTGKPQILWLVEKQTNLKCWITNQKAGRNKSEGVGSQLVVCQSAPAIQSFGNWTCMREAKL